MSKVLMVFYRSGQKNTKDQIDKITERINPDNIRPRPTLIRELENGLLAVFNPNENVLLKGGSVCLGGLVDMKDRWWKVREKKPEGTYAIIRHGKDEIEVLTDICGSRPLWYCQTKEVFAISTSQRAILPVLGDFQMEPFAVSWFLSSGQLGPGYSWDQRIRMVPPNSIFSFDLNNWSSKIDTKSLNFDISTEQDHREKLICEIERAVGSMDLNMEKWIVPLSGGVDSRGVLFFSKEYGTPSAMTRGLKSSLDEKGTDMYIAKKVASRFKVKHHVYFTDKFEEDFSAIMDRIIKLGECRIDHINHFMDGLFNYKDIYEKGYTGLLRGEHQFGAKTIRQYYGTDKDVRRNLGALMFSDYDNIDLGSFGLKIPFWPEDLKQRPDETYQQWRDRTRLLYRSPYCLTTIIDLITGYVETISPMTSSNIIDQMFRTPDNFRRDSNLWYSIVKRRSSGIPFADKDAIHNIYTLLTLDPIRNTIRNELEIYRGSVLPADLISFVMRKTSKVPVASMPTWTSRTRKWINNNIPGFLMKWIYKPPEKQTMNFFRLALRCYMIAKLEKIFEEDSKLFEMSPLNDFSDE